MERSNGMRHARSGHARRRRVWRGRDYLVFALLFAVVCALAFSSFVINERSFVWYQDWDGLTQHLVAHLYTGRWMRSVVRALLHGEQIPLWDFTIGQGADIITTFSHYTLGDPLALLMTFIPEHRAETFYNVFILVRFLLAGWAFVAYEHSRGHTGSKVVAAAMAYIFTAYTMIYCVRHPFFTNPVIYLPLLLIGVDRIYEKGRPTLFMCMLALSSYSDYYFLYMLSLAVFAYALYRFFDFEHEHIVREFLATGLRFLLYGCVSVLCAGIFLIPSLHVALNSSRSHITKLLTTLYPLKYYTQVFSQAVSPGKGDLYLGFSGPLLLGVAQLLSDHKGKRRLFVGVVVCTLFFMVPAAGAFLNVFIYPSSRWSFCYAFLLAHVFVLSWDRLTHLGKSAGKLVAVVSLFAIGIVATLYYGTTREGLSSAVLLLVAALILLVPESTGQLTPRVKGTLLSIFVIAGVVLNAYGLYGIHGYKYDKDFYERGKAYRAITETDYGFIRDTIDAGATTPVLRVERQSIWVDDVEDLPGHDLYNTNIVDGVSATQFYWSINEHHSTDRYDDLESTSYLSWMNTGYDQESLPLALAGVQYDVTEGDIVPYGFSECGYGERFLKSDDPLPYGYTYGSYLKDETYRSLDVSKRQQAMMQAVVVEDNQADGLALPGAQADQLTYDEVVVPYHLEHHGNISAVPDGEGADRASGTDEFNAQDGGTIELSFDGLERCETYLRISGVTAETVSLKDLYEDDDESFRSHEEFESLPKIDRNAMLWDDINIGPFSSSRFGFDVSSDVSSTEFTYVGPTYRWYNKRHNFYINLGYHEEALSHITIKVKQIGHYRFDNVEVVCQPMDQFDTWMDALREEHLDDVRFGTNAISGTITVGSDKMLVIPVSYADGWTATVDGETVPVLAANVCHLGVPLTAGTHEVVLSYRTSGLRLGICATLSGLVGVLILSILSRRERT